jgi:FKBP-type peptidyl-prolyl cis-trans isomerase (trigger factor)
MTTPTTPPAPYTILTKKTLKGGEIELNVQIPAELFALRYTRLLADARKEFELPGFRKGNVPENMFKDHVHEGPLLERAAYDTLDDLMPVIVNKEDIFPMVVPEVRITKLALGNPLECVVTIAPFPTIKLPDYKKIAHGVVEKASPAVVVDDSEVEKLIDQIRGMRAATAPAGADPATPFMPELTDEFVRGLGAFKDVAEFKAKLKENIALEKEYDARIARREKIAEALIEKTKFPIPAIVVQRESEAMDERFSQELVRLGITREEHLKKIGKTNEILVKEREAHIERQLRTRLIYDAIAKAEQILVSDEEAYAEAAQLQSRYPDMKSLELQNYAVILLTNMKVVELLEKS